MDESQYNNSYIWNSGRGKTTGTQNWSVIVRD